MARQWTEAGPTEGALMGLFDGIKGWLASNQVQARSAAPFTVSYEYPDLQTQLSTLTGWRRAHGGAYGVPSISDALAVPAILRCVTLISTSAGQLRMRGYLDGAEMDPEPRLITRPDPDRTPRGFYEPSTWNLATTGETVWCIMSRDGDGKASALVVVPLAELTVEANPRDRRRPKYTWGTDSGKIVSTRWTPTNQDGRFVHVFMNEEPCELRGKGPLQRAGLAASVSIEAQRWAANFYAAGGYPSMILHSETELEDTEADALASSWVNKPPNWPRVTSGDIDATEFGVNPQGAQMLDARMHQRGEVAEMFGMPGTMLEYNAPGSSLTYQNVGEVFSFFVKTCLQPIYLEPQEQAMSDLLPRTQAAAFNIDSFYRPDQKSRWEVYEIATKVIGVEEAAQWAREREGLAPGDVEYKPVLFAPPAAVPARLPSARVAAEKVELRCDGMMQKRKAGIAALSRCNRLLSETGVFVGRCPRCKKEYAAA
jgi:HK97 family phage portal protein